MPIRTLLCGAGLGALLAFSSALHSQTAAPSFHSLSPIAFDTAGPVLRAHTESEKPFTVAGEHGVVLGQQDGTFEAWALPIKVLSHLTLEANIADYTVPIDVNRQSAEIEVRPDRTVITYSHIGFTVRQIMFSPDKAAPGTGPVVLYQFDCLKPTDFVFRFTPELRWMWPERNEGTPGVEWVAAGADPHEVAGGFYVLHSDYPDLAAAVTIPGARAGILAPYQERPQVHPVELKLHIDPKDNGKLFPLLMAVGTDTASANSGALGQTLEKLDNDITTAYAAHDQAYKNVLADATSIDTPNDSLNRDFQWAVTSIEQLKTVERKSGETALVAGYYASADSARPGFGWFFGRDSLYTLYAVNGYGDFALTRSELEFLLHRQRADGKIMHEYSQTAADIDWKAFPYMYAAADATPLFLLAVNDYVRASGDLAFLTDNRAAIEKAWDFETSHSPDASHGGNGIYENTQGTGWVESWPGGMPHQEVYLALLDQQASAAMGALEGLLHDSSKAQSARQRAATIAKTINAQFRDAEKGCYAFSRNADGTLDRTTTVYPALAWWSGASLLEHSDECLRQFAEARMNTDWGLRDVSNQEKIYDGMSYHQGSVWPLFTGWAALAEYRGGQPLAGYQILMENANLTTAQDLGAVTELLSGDYFVPFGRSTSHQLWSSAMVITPILRGLFGIDIDAQTRTITVAPHLPASWDHAEVRNLPTPGGKTSLRFERKGGQLEVSIVEGGAGWRLRAAAAVPDENAGKAEGKHRAAAPDRRASQTIRMPLPPVEVDQAESDMDVTESAQWTSPSVPPLPGARTQKFRVIQAEYGAHDVQLTIEGLAGTDGVLRLFPHERVVPKVADGPGSISTRSCDANAHGCASLPLSFHFPEGEGWKTVTVKLAW